MRLCAACQHENADHLGFCVECGRRLPGGQRLPVAPSVAATLELRSAPRAVDAIAPAAVRPRLGLRGTAAWLRGSVLYVFSHLHGRIENLRRRRALESERDGEQRLLRRAVTELGEAVRAGGIETPGLRSLIEAARQAETRRDAAAASLAEAERLQIEEDARLVAAEREAGAQVRAGEAALAQAEESLRSAVVEQQALATLANGATGAVGELPTVNLPRGVAQLGQLETRIAGLRADVDRLRTELQGARLRLDQAVAGRRQAARDLAVSLAGRRRDRNDAETQLHEHVERLGDATLAQRPAAPALDPIYERIAQLAGTVVLREQQLQQLERDLERLDPARLTAGLILLAVPLLATVVLWLSLR